MKKLVRFMMIVVSFPFTILTLPIFALGYWVEGKELTYPQAVKKTFRIWILNR